MPLDLFNTLSREKEPFEPLEPGQVRLYVCGPTVYDYAHIGNARPVVVFDVLYRLLQAALSARSPTSATSPTSTTRSSTGRARSGEPIDSADRAHRRRPTTTTWRRWARCRPTIEPRATQHVAEMIGMIETLIDARPRLCRRGPRAVQRSLACPTTAACRAARATS